MSSQFRSSSLPTGRMVIPLLLSLLGGVALSACSQSQSAQSQAPATPEVGVVSVQTRPLTLTTELAGRTTAYQVAQIRPQIGGIVQQRIFAEGGMVKAGDLLYQIDPSTYQAAYDNAKATVAKAEATLHAAELKAKRQAALLEIEAVSTQTNEDAEAARQEAAASLAEARASLETARINLAHTRITAPIAGRVETSSVTPGALVTANQETALTTVQQLDPIYVDIPQSSADVLQLRQALASGRLQATRDGQVPIRLQLEDGSTYAYPGKLQFSGSTVNATTGAITLRAVVPNPNHLLMPGMYVRASLDKGSDPNAVLVPQKGIARTTGGKASALVVHKNGKVEQRNVTVADAVGQDWYVTSGLTAGDRLIVEGTSKVKPGQFVRTVEVAAASAAAAAQTSSNVVATR